MHRKELARICELRDPLHDPGSPNAYFLDFDNSIVTEPVKRKHFIDIEADLQGLDPVGWDWLKGEVAPLFEQRHPTRGWQAAFDKLNQAKAYNHLVQVGCTSVEFVPESAVHGQKTPDLQGSCGSTKILCEVKTINISDDEAVARNQIAARRIQGRLPDTFFQKLRSTLETAKKQMAIYYPSGDAKRLIYVIVNFDDNLNEYVGAYSEQLQLFVNGDPVPGIEIALDMKPAYYSATA
jgi:hypothetical protein